MTVVQYRLSNGEVVSTYREAISSGLTYETVLLMIEGKTLQELPVNANTD